MRAAPLEVGERVRLRLESLAAGGEAVGRHEGMAVFAMWGCPGDEAEVEITEVSRSFGRGVVREVREASPDRVEERCSHFGECGGCQLQHIAYPAQLRHKAAIVREALARIGGLPEVEVGEAWGMQEPWRYRSRCEYHAAVEASGELALGFARHRSHEVVPLRECPIQHPLSERVRAAVVGLFPRAMQGGAERAALLSVELLISFDLGAGVATLVCDGRPGFLGPLAEELMARVPGLAGVAAARRRGQGSPHRSPAEAVAGQARVTERLGEGTYRVSADSFFQVNPAQAARVVGLLEQWAELRQGESVLDCYSGVGTFLLPLARRVGRGGRAAGIEGDESALGDARANVRRWSSGNVRLHRGRVEKVLARLAREGDRFDVVVLDPPRRGCGPVVCAHVARLGPRRILMVSCHPATLARDLAFLAEHGYRCRRVQPVDMFPQTWHVEAVALCERV